MLNKDPFFLFKEHSAGTNNNTEVVLLEAIRSTRPFVHITPVSATECDIRGWATAGHASIILLRQENHFVARRRYHAPESRLEGNLGKLDDHVTFGE